MIKSYHKLLQLKKKVLRNLKKTDSLNHDKDVS